MSSLHRSQSQTFALLGISGSGKGTVAALLLKALPRMRCIGTGDALRRIMRKRNRTGRYIKRILAGGGIVPHWAASYIWLHEFIERLRGDEDLLLDGSPRLVSDAKLLDDFMADIGRPQPRAIYLDVSVSVARMRLFRRGRYDDNPRAIAGRFRFFQKSVRKVIRHYLRRGRLIRINGDQTIPEVWRDVGRALKL